MPPVTTLPPVFTPTEKQSKDRSRIYKHLQTMRDLKDKVMPHFQTGPDGPRSFNAYIDDSEKILNGYTLGRDDQGKEEWQSNLMDNITRAKLRAIAAGVGLKVPEMEVVAVNDDGIHSAHRAELAKNILNQTYTDGNPTLNTFLEVWHMMAHGVTFEYEGYKTGGCWQEVVDSFNTVTGEVKTHREYRKMDGKPFCTLINPPEFLWWTFFVRDIQDQPRIAWIQHYTGRELEIEFSKFPNFKYVRDKKSAASNRISEDTLYMAKWAERVSDEDDYEVIKYYSKADEGSKDAYGYEIWVNGVPLLQCPLLWGDKEKVYPFAKQISEPFANSNFFVGMSFPGLLEAYQDGKNTVLNTLIDKLYQGVSPLKLVGLQNRDLLDVESNITSQDNTVYVPDINAVKFMEHPGINNGELAMLKLLDYGLESESIDKSQQGQAANTGSRTAREVVIADERSREIKGVLFMFLEDLWIQKTKLRIGIVLSHYLKDKAAQETTRGKIISIKDYTFGDGARGILDIYVAKGKSDTLSIQDIEAREAAMEEQGIAYKLVVMNVEYLNDWRYDIKIVAKSLEKANKTSESEELMAEIQQVTTLFPEFFVANKDKYLEDILELHNKHIGDYNPPVVPPPMPMEPTEAAPAPGASVTPLDQGAALMGATQ
jgi:hypothetical protein